MSAIALPARVGAVRSTVTASIRTPKAALRFAPLKKSVGIRSRAVRFQTLRPARRVVRTDGGRFDDEIVVMS